MREWVAFLCTICFIGAGLIALANAGSQPRHTCTVRDIQRNVTTIRTGRILYEGQDLVCELGGE